MSYTALLDALSESGLSDFGTFKPTAHDTPICLLGPSPDFWPIVTASAEFTDGAADPIDRWSKRVIGAIAQALGATALFPSDGPPYPPFLAWAVASGRAFHSPVGMLVHDRAGLLVSFRGALQFDRDFPIPEIAQTSPCQTCVEKPCLTACPVNALGPTGYDVPRCKDFLQTEAGYACMNAGCRVRVSCPISEGAARDPAQSAYHMRVFLG